MNLVIMRWQRPIIYKRRISPRVDLIQELSRPSTWVQELHREPFYPSLLTLMKIHEISASDVVQRHNVAVFHARHSQQRVAPPKQKYIVVEAEGAIAECVAT